VRRSEAGGEEERGTKRAVTLPPSSQQLLSGTGTTRQIIIC
jgi:hypothetical protein